MSTKIGLRDILDNELYIGDTVVFTMKGELNGDLDFGNIVSFRTTPKMKMISVQPLQKITSVYGHAISRYVREFHMPINDVVTKKMVLYRR